MSTKILVNLKNGTDLRNFKQGDILMFDAVNQEFYRVTQNAFFDKYEKKLNDLLKKYDSVVEGLEKKYQKLEKDYNDFANQIKDSNKKLIDFVKKDNALEGINGNE